MPGYALSYVLTTYNKLPYLRQVVERLVAARQPDEEIVVTDGGSTDGTPEYLQGLLEAGLIQQFTSERDKGEAHGFNKGLLRARGELLKLVTDDDAFCYPAIREARLFMLAHPEIDVLTGNTGLMHLEALGTAQLYADVAANFRRWMANRDVVWLIGLPLLIRRSSLAITGLFHTGVVQVDTEFTYRITSLNVNLAWSTAMLSVRLENPHSNLRLINQGRGANASRREGERMRFYYDQRIGNGFYDFVRYKSEWIERLIKPLRPVKRALFDLLDWPQYQGNPILSTCYAPDPAVGKIPNLATAFAVADQLMTDYNAAYATEFLFKPHTLVKVLS